MMRVAPLSGTMAAISGHKVTTRGLLLRALAVILLLTIAATGVAIRAASVIGGAARAIGQDAEPSVALALRMAATLADMDAVALADCLTDNAAATGTSRRFRDGANRLAADIVEASRNITYGEAEAAPLRELQKMLALYQDAVSGARTAGSNDVWLISRRVQWASRVNRLMTIPEATALAAVNAAQLEQRYADYLATSLIHGGAAGFLFATLTAVLLAVQVWLAGRVRRLINPLLAVATGVAAAAGIWFGLAVLGERTDLRIAKADAYDSLLPLFLAKTTANAVRADVALWLLDADARGESQSQIKTGLRAIIAIELDEPGRRGPVLGALASALQFEQKGEAGRALLIAPHMGGFLGKELDNITFGVPEREAAHRSVAAFVRAVTAIQAIQQVEQLGHHAQVVAAWTGSGPGDGDAVFGALQAALDETISVNQAAFDAHVESALHTSWSMPFVIAGGMGLTALLAAAGLWPRLREYQ